MKRSKFFLGATAALLAVASVAAAKRYGLSKVKFYITVNSGTWCVPVSVLCTGNGTVTCFFVFTDWLGQQHAVPTWTKGNPTSIVPVGPNACQGKKFTWDGFHL